MQLLISILKIKSSLSKFNKRPKLSVRVPSLAMTSDGRRVGLLNTRERTRQLGDWTGLEQTKVASYISQGGWGEK